jgi:hypothetical protein
MYAHEYLEKNFMLCFAGRNRRDKNIELEKHVSGNNFLGTVRMM